MHVDEKELIREIVQAKSPISLQFLTRRFRIKGDDRRAFRMLLAELEHQGKIARVSGKNYTAPSGRSSLILGRLEVTSRGFGFIRPNWTNLKGKPPFEGDLFIAARDLGAALDGDIVRAEYIRSERGRPSGRIQEVLEHAHKRVVGLYQATNARESTVLPRSSRLDRRVVVTKPDPALGVSDFDWVEVEITEFTPAPQPLLGKVIARLGRDEDRGIDVLLVLRDRGIIEEFPKSVEAEVEQLRFDWSKDLAGRTDYRKLPTITIDPKTAKDFDDALSIEVIGKDRWRLYVHIADVAHFVRQGTALDNEAIERSTSVYPTDRVVPMLPTKISNYLCSLVPHEDRLAVTAVMEIDGAGHILNMEFHNSVIHSAYRFAYEQVQEFFDWHDKAGKDAVRPAQMEPFESLDGMLLALRAVARKLRQMRFDRGALDLDIPQATVIFDDKGKVSDLKFYPRFEAHQLVEECMLIANEAVATHLTKKDVPLLYRVHEVADEDRLERLAPVLRIFGIKLGGGKKGITPHDLQAALDKAQELPAGHIVRRLILRALKRAEYDPVNVGHFGLASECYCHFTSPIRRYPDVVVHRQLKSLIERKPLVYARDENDLDGLGEHTSSRERRAQEAEWEAIALKSLEFMKPHEGEEMDGYIAGVQSFGLFVELAEYPVEGMIPRMSLRDDDYDMDDDGIQLVGRRTGRRLRLADRIRVRIDKIDIFAQQMNLSLVSDDNHAPAARIRKTVKRGNDGHERRFTKAPKHASKRRKK
ncbi:ribonuclease R [bacterium]|nr:ribonuclease R [bacterium]